MLVDAMHHPDHLQDAKAAEGDQRNALIAFLRHTAMAWGTKRAALPSKASPKTNVTISLILIDLRKCRKRRSAFSDDRRKTGS